MICSSIFNDMIYSLDREQKTYGFVSQSKPFVCSFVICPIGNLYMFRPGNEKGRRALVPTVRLLIRKSFYLERNYLESNEA